MKTSYKSILVTKTMTTVLALLMISGHAKAEENPVEEALQFTYKHEPFSKYHHASMKPIAEDVDPVTGQLTLAVTDISLPGNNDLKVELRRKYESDYKNGNSTSDFIVNGPNVSTGWSLDLPFVRGFYLKDTFGAQPVNTFGGQQPCSQGVEDVRIGQGHAPVHPYTYWDGKLLHIPGVVTEKFVDGVNSLVPPYNWRGTSPDAFVNKQVTKSNHKISGCPWDAEKQNEAIEVTGPEGKVYTFSQIRDFDVQEAAKIGDLYEKYRRMILLTKVEDRFGNYVDYNYDTNGLLESIIASDGRTITIDYQQIGGKWYLKSATANERTWTYDYDTADAKFKVTQPDNTTWKYPDLTRLTGYFHQSGWDLNRGHCNAKGEEQSFTIEDPDGLQTTYTTNTVSHGRINVKTYFNFNVLVENAHFPWPVDRISPHGLAPNIGVCQYYRSIVRKDVTGSELPTYTWHYSYSQNHGQYSQSWVESFNDAIHFSDYNGSNTVTLNLIKPDFAENARAQMAAVNAMASANIALPAGVSLPGSVSSLAAVKTTTITGPNSKTVYYIDRDAESPSEGKTLAIDHYDGNTLLKREEMTYAVGQFVGDMRIADRVLVEKDELNPTDYGHIGITYAATENQVVMAKHRIYIYDAEGASTWYDTEHLTHNAYGKPTKTKESNSITSSSDRYTKNEYQHYPDEWFFNFPRKVEISTKDSDYTTTRLRTYYAPTFASPGYKLNPKYDYDFDTSNWQVYYKQYHSNGQRHIVEFNSKTAASLGGTLDGDNRKIVYTNYKRGTPQNTTYFSRDSNNSTVSTSKVVDDNGWITRHTTTNNVTVNYGHDAMGRMVWVDMPADSVHSRQWLDHYYSWSGTYKNTLTIKHCRLNNQKNGCQDDTEQFRSTITYDGLLRPVQVANRDVSNNQTRYQNKDFDAYNRETFASYWSKSSTEAQGNFTTYDKLGRVHTRQQSGGGTITNTYKSGNRIEVNDARGNVTTTTYQAFGKPAFEQFTEISSPESVTTSQKIDIFGNVTQITQSGKNASNQDISLTEYRAYNSNKKLCKISRADVGTTLFEYNTLGQVTAKSEGEAAGTLTACGTLTASKKIDYTYDNLGDVYKIDYPDGHYITSLYDNHGNLTSLSTPNTVRTYSYNNLDMLEDESLSIGSEKVLSLDYAYSNLGHRSSITYPDNYTVTFAPNGFGEPTQAVRTRGSESAYNYATSATWYPNGSIDTFTYGNGLTHKTTLNSRKLPQSVRDYNGGVNALYYTYGYDNNQNVTALTDHINSAFSLTSLTYDGLDRLTNTSGGSGIGSSTIAYDGLGNITSYASKDRNLTYTYNYTANAATYGDSGVNRLRSVSDSIGSKDYAFFSYDDRGNITNTSFNGLTFNRANQVTAAATTTGSSNSYLYDGHNRRVKKTSSKGIEYSFYGQDGTLLYRENQADGGGINYIYLGKKLIAKDGFIPENSGKQHYRPYGESIEGAPDDVGYTGHKFDKDLGLSYMQARYYDPVIGRFYSNDPVDTLGHMERENPVHGFGRYTYANNNPYKYVDPDGNESRMAVASAADVRSFGAGKISRKQLQSRMSARAKASRIALKNTPVARAASAALQIASIALSESSDESDKPDEEKSEEEIKEERRVRRQETIDDWVDGHLPNIHDNHGMEGETNRKEDGGSSSNSVGGKRRENKFEDR